MDDKNIGKEIKGLCNAIGRFIERQQDQSEMVKISGSNGWILKFIYENSDRDVYQKDLEEEFGITRSTISKVLILMEKKGLIKRVPVEHDARLKKLVLTDKTMKMSEKMREGATKMESQLTAGFTKEEIDSLTDYIKRMKDNISK